METQNRGVNAVFLAVALLLGVAAVTGMYFSRNQPSIFGAAIPSVAESGQLPEDHPPIDPAARTAALEQASRNDPQDADLKTQIGNAYYDAGQYQRAIEAYLESLKLKPQDPAVETDLATCYHMIGQHDEAIRILERVLRYQPGFAQALFNKGIILQVGKGDARGAVAAWEELLRANPGFSQKGKIEERIRELKSSVK